MEEMPYDILVKWTANGFVSNAIRLCATHPRLWGVIFWWLILATAYEWEFHYIELTKFNNFYFILLLSTKTIAKYGDSSSPSLRYVFLVKQKCYEMI